MVTRDPRATAMTEAELMEYVRAMVKDLRLLAYHAHDGRRSWGPGFPDLVIVGRAGCIWRECKTEHGSLSPEQRQWGDALKRAGQNWRIWRPTDRLDGSIARELTDLAAVQLALFGAAP
jgi:hypothetical protein